MAIDSSLFGATIPAGSYAAGDRIPLAIVDGPAVVRSGRGAAILKRFTTGTLSSLSGAGVQMKVSIKNSDWVDPVISATTDLYQVTSLDEKNGCVQRGNNCPLTPNSSWEIYAEFTQTVTTTKDNGVFAIIDIDYPSVSAIVNPDALVGIPASLEVDQTTTVGKLGTFATTAKWDWFNVDIFKAGYEYALTKVELLATGGAHIGFIALANAAGMGGLSRIIPINNVPNTIRNMVEYSTKLVKGPMDVKFMLFDFNDNGGTITSQLVLDFVKRRV